MLSSESPCLGVSEQGDVKTTCKDAKADEGQVQECLAQHRPALSWDCQEQLFRQEVENADDLRLSVRLFRACLADKKQVRSAGRLTAFRRRPSESVRVPRIWPRPHCRHDPAQRTSC